ncbi:MAG TPA: GNAT family N-acetyltransferase [Candidatus Tyrphobacter sp.]
MTVERIVSIADFDRFRPAYESVYNRDPHRTVFVSWPWLRSYLPTMPRHWVLLAARSGEEYVGFLVVVGYGIEAGPVKIYRELGLGAYPSADYTGLVAANEEPAIVEAFAAAIESMPWDVLRARSVRDPRVRALVTRLGEGKVVTREEGTPCHVVPLPSSWDEYLAQNRNGKQALRYALRRRNAWAEASFTDADSSTIERDVEALLRLHKVRWKSNLPKARRTYGRLFLEAHARGCCRVGVLWSEEKKPLAAQAAFIDPERRSWGIYMLAYDTSVSKHSPGIGMLMRGIERAISERFEEYDFLRGDEAYKARFGSEVRWLENFTIRRRSRRVRFAESAWTHALRAKRVVRSFIMGRIRASA